MTAARELLPAVLALQGTHIRTKASTGNSSESACVHTLNRCAIHDARMSLYSRPHQFELYLAASLKTHMRIAARPNVDSASEAMQYALRVNEACRMTNIWRLLFGQDIGPEAVAVTQAITTGRHLIKKQDDLG
jgi:hypothetical protein